MGSQKEFIAQIEKLKKEFEFASEMAILINADRLKHLERIVELEITLKRQNAFIRDIAENWDCDADSHTYNIPCRKCEAEKLLKPKPATNDTEQ